VRLVKRVIKAILVSRVLLVQKVLKDLKEIKVTLVKMD
jgi:hypothetical protein